MKENGKRKKIEASKKIIIVNYIIFIGVVIATFTALFKGIDLTSIIPFDMGILGLITAANAHYYSKSRQENILRLTQAYELAEEDVKAVVKHMVTNGESGDDMGAVGCG